VTDRGWSAGPAPVRVGFFQMVAAPTTMSTKQIAFPAIIVARRLNVR
jgi:hypothetical protein